MMFVLTVNTGSSSLKATLYEEDGLERKIAILVDSNIESATAYGHAHFEDPPKIANWIWVDVKKQKN